MYSTSVTDYGSDRKTQRTTEQKSPHKYYIVIFDKGKKATQ